MLEILLASRGGGEPEPTGDVLFLYDPATNKDLISNTVVGALRTATTVDTLVTLDGQPTVKFGSTAAGAIITLPTPINLEALAEWTVEWSSRPTSMSSSYMNEIFLDLLNTAGYPLGCRWADGGYGNRLQFNISNFANSNLWRPPVDKSAALNKENRWAMVYKGGQVKVYRDGVKQMLAAGTNGGTGTQDFISKTQPFFTVAKIYIGWYNGTNVAFIGNMGRIRISAFARYLGNYSPKPF